MNYNWGQKLRDIMFPRVPICAVCEARIQGIGTPFWGHTLCDADAYRAQGAFELVVQKAQERPVEQSTFTGDDEQLQSIADATIVCLREGGKQEDCNAVSW